MRRCRQAIACEYKSVRIQEWAPECAVVPPLCASDCASSCASVYENGVQPSMLACVPPLELVHAVRYHMTTRLRTCWRKWKDVYVADVGTLK
eukprot:2325594-Pleurochrysis_carterae.AAC.1